MTGNCGENYAFRQPEGIDRLHVKIASETKVASPGSYMAQYDAAGVNGSNRIYFMALR